MAPSAETQQNGHVSNGCIPNGNTTATTTATGSAHGKYGHGNATRFLWQYATFKKLFFLVFVIPLFITYFLEFSVLLYPVMVAVSVVPMICLFVGVNNFLYTLTSHKSQTSKLDKYVEFTDKSEEAKHAGTFMPIRDVYELYVDGKMNFKGDVLECLERRNEFVSYKLQWWHLKFVLSKLVPELIHVKQQDREQVCDHYDRGNDFYESFLGPMMIYTSGIRTNEEEDLQQLQKNKLKKVFEKIMLKSTDRHLDIGCGWGTLCNAAAETVGACSTGVTIAKEQVQWAESKSSESGLNKAKFLNMDYREIPEDSKYDKITCLEMAEHVGIRLFPNFLNQVYRMLDDDGVFFLQIAGLRRAYQWEDFMWGFFMDTYIFPGADASLPLTFPVGELEAAGFEIQSVETVGIHYSDTIRCWYENWVRPEVREEISMKYGARLYKVWEIFLAWSTIIARQGNSTCFQIVAHKNLDNYPRKLFKPFSIS